MSNDIPILEIFNICAYIIVSGVIIRKLIIIGKQLEEKINDNLELTKQLYHAKGQQAGADSAKKEAAAELKIIAKVEVVNPEENPVIVKPLENNKHTI